MKHYAKIGNKIQAAALTIIMVFSLFSVMNVNAAARLNVTYSNPQDGNENVSLDSIITVMFNGEIQKGNNYFNIELRDWYGKNTPIALSIYQNQLIIKPENMLEQGAFYSLSIPYDAVKDFQGNILDEDYQIYFSTESDTTCPEIVSTTPKDASENVDVDSIITVKFSEPIKAGRYVENIKIYDDYGNTVPSNLSINGDTLRIKPYFKLKNEKTYLVNIPQDSIKDRAGNGLYDDGWVYFTTKPEVDYLEIKSTNPSNNSKYIPINETIMVLFDDEIYDNGDLKNITLKDNKGNIPVDVSISNNSLYIMPKNGLNFAYNTTYTLNIPTGTVKNSSGKSTEKSCTLSFTTESQVPSPKIMTASPQNGCDDASVNTILRIYYNEKISQADGFNDITLKKKDGDEVKADITVSDDQLVIKPSTELEYDTMYTYTIPYGAIKNLNGDLMKTNYEFTFKTEKEKFPPKVAESYPSNNSINTAVDSTISIMFSEEISKGDNFDYITLRDRDYNTIPIIKNITGNMLSIVLENKLNMAFNTDYILTVPYGAVKDAVGNLFEDKFTLNFRTGDEKFSPVIKFAEPCQNSSDVPVDKPIVLTFTSSINRNSNINNIILTDSKGNKAGIISEASNDKLIIKPDSNLLYDTEYRLSIPIGAVKDTWDNTMKENFLLTFKTMKERIPPQVRNSTPAVGAKLVDTKSQIEINFSEKIVKGKNFAKMIFVDEYLNAIPYTAEISNERLLIKPKSSLTGNASYTIRILSDSIKDTSDNVMAKDYVLSFSTKEAVFDKNALSVKGVTMAKDYSAFGIYFSDNIVWGNGAKNIAVKDSNGKAISIYTTIYNNMLVINSKTKLSSGKKYTIIIPSAGVKGKSGKILGSNYNYSFTKK